MLIARLIADNLNWKTRVDEMMRGLAPTSQVGADVRAVFVEPLSAVPHVLEMHFDTDEVRLVSNVLETHFPGCDHLITSHEVQLPRLFISDMDSTMIEQECIDELADFAGLKEKISDITERAMQGELDFETALLERVGLLKDLGEEAIDQCLAERISPTPGARTVTQTLRAHGARTVLVTGGFHHFADRVAEWLGFDRVVGNRLGVAKGKLTGLLDGPISDANTKLATLREEAAKLGEGTRVLATGDGANDIPMIEAAHYGFAYRAKPKARDMANGRVDQPDLTALLSLLGIPEKDWETG
ncbi:MAG: phosphoserine phosphatase SerB [Erythrobacter sp.]|uniref:phosphoserine phosphatase SerB n=1 Tax=Erythrobacter sp. TaxID=1042 RepID=UPI0032636A92